jgi:CheY-like chemotaxis protein
MTCFLIDDDPDDRKFFQLALNTLDSKVELITASNGVDALEKVNSTNFAIPDYVFLDLNMPYMSGKECLIRLRDIRAMKNVPIILYSTIRKDYEELSSRWASAFITKPNSIGDLVKILSSILVEKSIPLHNFQIS